jgi:hypothetical protein
LGESDWSSGAAGLYNDHASELSTFYLRPSANTGDRLVLYTWEPFTGFGDDLDAAVGFPPGYARALRWNLASEMAPSFISLVKIPQPLLDTIERKAVESKGRIKAANTPLVTLQCDASLVAGRQTYDWRY